MKYNLSKYRMKLRRSTPWKECIQSLAVPVERLLPCISVSVSLHVQHGARHLHPLSAVMEDHNQTNIASNRIFFILYRFYYAIWYLIIHDSLWRETGDRLVTCSLVTCIGVK